MTRRNGSKLTERSHDRERAKVPRVVQLATGLAAPSAPVVNAAASAAATALRETGDPAAAALLGQLGGLRRAERERGLRVLVGLGLKGTPPEALAPYLDDAEGLAMHEIARLAREVGGGECSAGPSSIIQSAALQLAASRAAFAAGDTMLGSKLADASRSNLLCAHELCAREAKARPNTAKPLWRQIAEEADAAVARAEAEAATVASESSDAPPVNVEPTEGNS